MQPVIHGFHPSGYLPPGDEVHSLAPPTVEFSRGTYLELFSGNLSSHSIKGTVPSLLRNMMTSIAGIYLPSDVFNIVILR
jgi:hypothetical protein